MKIFMPLISIFLLLQTALATDFTDCGSKHGNVSAVTVSGCPKSPCVFKRGTTVNFEVDFTSNEGSKSAKAVVHGIIGGVPLPFPLPKTDACKYGGISCPLTSGTKYNYKLAMPILTSYPPLSVTAKWELQDENGEDLFCVEVPAKIE